MQPDNLSVVECDLGNAYVQQEYSSISCSEVTGERMRLGVNVLAQLVAVCHETDTPGMGAV